MNRFEDKVAIVSGAGTGIGRAVVQRFAAEGARGLFLVAQSKHCKNARK